jgi:hypothetical protein
MGQWQPCDGYIKENVVILKLYLSNIETVGRKIFLKKGFSTGSTKLTCGARSTSLGLRHIAAKGRRNVR